ncbi:hypothetical protein OY671_011625, partial [Metschnikowia pulcherrima]
YSSGSSIGAELGAMMGAAHGTITMIGDPALNPMTFDDLSDELPLIAISRGLTPGEAGPVARASFDCGFRCSEVPLNSPEPFVSIRAIVDTSGDTASVGAGTVSHPDDVQRVQDAGGQIVISPNCNT